jgi:type I restriction enzyme S subunit
MIENLKPYPEYKDSGLPWLGKVPAHWEIRRNGGLFQQRNDPGDAELPILEVSLRTGVRVRDFAASKRKQVMTDRSKYKRAGRGDLVYNMMRMWQGAAGIAPESGLVSPAYVVCRAMPGIDSGYFSRLFKTDDYLAEIDAASRGIVKDRNRLYWDQFKQICSPLPPASEQAAITRFLAWATNRLDRAIGAKRRIIALLQEQKQAVIHRAVTRGLDPSVPLKDSGIPWLGEIPEHWEVRRLRTVVKTIDQGVSPLATGFLAEGNSWGVLKSGCVNRGVFRETEHKQLSQSFKIDSSIVVKPGDVLISRACGSPSLVGSVGRVGKLNYNLILSDKTFRPNFEEGVDADFMVLAMNSTYYRRQVEQAISGAEGMANNLPISSLRDFSLAIPLLDEAKAIAFSINKRLAVINLAIASNEQEITLLREYRTRLMADVVTGKLDVREVAAGLPEEIEPSIQSVVPGYDAAEAEDDPDSDPIDTEED